MRSLFVSIFCSLFVLGGGEEGGGVVGAGEGGGGAQRQSFYVGLIGLRA